MFSQLLLGLCLLSIINVLNAEVRISGILNNSMILQIPYPEIGVRPTNIFGTAFLNETVFIKGTSGFPGPFTAKPNCTHIPHCIYGNFSIPIIPNINDKSFPGPYNITIQSLDNKTNDITFEIILSNVYFGEVLLCSGQSNMGYALEHCTNYQHELNISHNYENIRMYQSNWTYFAPVPAQNISYQFGYNWIPPIAKPNNFATYSCICYTVGRMLVDYLRNISALSTYVGLILADVGGTTIWRWVDNFAGIACNLTGDIPYKGEAGSNNVGGIYNGMVAPIGYGGNGISVREFIWYQGEADSGENDAFSTNNYVCLLNGLIYTWRKNFNQPNLTFINIQLPGNGVSPYSNQDECNKQTIYGGFNFGWQGIQKAQEIVYNMQSNTGLVSTEDQGQESLHYSYKMEVAKRVFLWTRYLTFNDNSINKYHLKHGIDPLNIIDIKTNNKNVKNINADNYKHMNPPYFINAFKTDPLNMTVFINIGNTGPNGLILQPSYNCSSFGNVPKICTTNCTDVYCCDMNGANTIKFKLEGWYFYNYAGKTNGTYEKPGLWGWLPGKVIKFINNKDNTTTAITTPILPPIWGTFPSPGFVFVKNEYSIIRSVVVGSNGGCVWSNTYNVPISPGGPYEITSLS